MLNLLNEVRDIFIKYQTNKELSLADALELWYFYNLGFGDIVKKEKKK